MKKYIVLIFLFSYLWSCNNSKNIVSNKNEVQKRKIKYPCSLCDSLFSKNKIHIPKERFVNIDGWWIYEQAFSNDKIWVTHERLERVVPFHEGNMKIFNSKEFALFQNTTYCFIGKTKSELRKLFKEADEIVGAKNGIYFSYYIGNVPEYDGKPTDFRVEEQRYIRFFNFSADSIFLGVKKDSIKLLDCIEKGK